MMKRGDVWWTQFGPSVGTEVQKTGPAVIVSNDAANRALKRCVVIPISSKVINLYPGQIPVVVNNREGKALPDQIMAADKSRLKSRIGVLTDSEMEAINLAIRQHLDV